MGLRADGNPNPTRTDLTRGKMTFESVNKARTNTQKGKVQQSPKFGSLKIDLRAAMREVDKRYQDNHLQVAYDNAKTDTEKGFYGDALNKKAEIEKSGQLTQEHMQKIENLVHKGYSVAEAVQIVDGETSRKQLVNKMEVQGYTAEQAEKMIPKNMDQQLAEAREKGVDEVNKQYEGFKDHQGNFLAINEQEKQNIINRN